MFGKTYFEPWVGALYGKNELKLLVLGDSRYDEEFTDKQIIQGLVNGSYRHQTFTKFVQAAIGTRHWEPNYNESASSFWNRVVFCNYNTTFFPGGPREPEPESERMNCQNAQLLREVLREWKPTHAVVWGFGNWGSLEVDGGYWSEPETIPGTVSKLYHTVTVDGYATLFAPILHPSSSFSYDEWRPMLKAFLTMKA